jgi:hypothetical protein
MGGSASGEGTERETRAGSAVPDDGPDAPSLRERNPRPNMIYAGEPDSVSASKLPIISVPIILLSHAHARVKHHCHVRFSLIVYALF